MKSIAMIVAATAAVLAVNTSGAVSQEACSKGYVSCMGVCAERPTKTMQDTCMNSCQTKNNQCSAEVFGSRRESGPPVAMQAPVEGKKALAKEASPPPRNVDIAPRKADTGVRKAEGSLRKVDVPARRKAQAPMQDKGGEPAEQARGAAPEPLRDAPSEPVEAQK